MYNVTSRALRALHHRWEHKSRIALSDSSSFLKQPLDTGITRNRLEPWFEKLQKEIQEFADQPSTLEAQLNEIQPFAYDSNTPIANAKVGRCL